MASEIIKGNLKKLQDQSFKTQREVAEMLGLHEASYTKMLKSGSIQVKTIDKFVKLFPRLNVNWLLYNKGNMYLDSSMNVVFDAEVIYESGKLEKMEQMKKEIQQLNKQVEDLQKDKMFLQDLLLKYQSSEMQPKKLQ
jgi:hypothetical protein